MSNNWSIKVNQRGQINKKQVLSLLSSSEMETMLNDVADRVMQGNEAYFQKEIVSNVKIGRFAPDRKAVRIRYKSGLSEGRMWRLVNDRTMVKMAGKRVRRLKRKRKATKRKRRGSRKK